MRRALLAIFLACLAGDALVAAWIVWAARFDRTWLLDVRAALFTSPIADPAAFDAPPAALLAAGFQTDPPELIAEWRERLPHEVDYLRGVPEALVGRSELEIVRALVPLFSKNGGGACGGYRDLLDNVQRLPRGDGLGCCSDHVQVLIAIGSTLGLFVRQVHHVSHTMAEVWVPSLGQWVFVDPHYAVLAREPGGRWLSLLELRERYFAGAPVDWEFIGTEHHRFATVRPEDWELYDAPDDFATIKLLWGNDVFDEDRLDRRLGWLPRPVRQIIGLAAGELPRFRVLDDAHTDEPRELERLRSVYLGVAALLAAGTLLPPLALRLARRPPA
jgi:hypothetical protein